MHDFIKLTYAVRLPTHEQALQAFREVSNINARYLDQYDSILHYVISNFRAENLRASDFRSLIELGVEVNVKEKQGETPLHFLAKYPNAELSKILFDHGADIHAVDEIGNNVLWRAVKDYRGGEEPLDFIRSLIARRADLDLKNTYGISAREIILQRMEPSAKSPKEWDLSEFL